MPFFSKSLTRSISVRLDVKIVAIGGFLESHVQYPPFSTGVHTSRETSSVVLLNQYISIAMGAKESVVTAEGGLKIQAGSKALWNCTRGGLKVTDSLIN